MLYSIVLAGEPGVGKSTLVKTVLEALPPAVPIAGIMSREVRVAGRREGFTVRSVGGPEGVLASPDLGGEPRFGTVGPGGRRRLGLSLTHLEQAVCPRVTELLPQARLIVIDELGAMQAESEIFRALIEEILRSGVPLLATAGVSPHPWLSSLQNFPELAYIQLTKNNREAIREMIRTYVLAETSRVS